MFNDVFEGTDFGNIDSKKDKENEMIEDAKKKDIWHSGKKQDMWMTYDEYVWELMELEDEDEGEPITENTKSYSSSGIFGDIFG